MMAKKSIELPKKNSYVLFNDKIDIVSRLDVKYNLPKTRHLDALFANCSTLEKYLDFCDRGSQPKFVKQSEYYVVKSKDVNWAFPNEDTLENISTENYTNNPEIQLKVNDVLVNGTGDGTACRPSIWLSKKKSIADGHVTILRTKSKLSPIFLYIFLTTKFGYLQLERQVTGSTGQLELYPEHIANIKIPEFSEDKIKQVEKLVSESYNLYCESNNKLKQAQNLVKKLIEDKFGK